MDCGWVALCRIHRHLVSTCISNASSLHSPWLLHRLSSFAWMLLSDQTERRHSTSPFILSCRYFLFEWHSLHCFLFPLSSILCCHSAYLILTTDLWNRAQICIYARDNLSPTTFGCGLPDQIINTCVLTPVLSCGRAHCDYNLIETNTLCFQVWTRPEFPSPSDLNLPSQFF